MSYYDAKRQLQMDLRNGVIDEQRYRNELEALEYARGEMMNYNDDCQGVTV